MFATARSLSRARGRRWLAVLAVALVGLGITITGAVAAQADGDTPVVQSGSISGYLLDAFSGAGLAGVTVSLSSIPTPVTTGSDGAYSFSDVPLGSYGITVSPVPGYRAPLLAPLLLSAAEPTIQLNILMVSEVAGNATFSGHVTDASTGAAIDGAHVTMNGLDVPFSADVATVAGVFSITQIPVGQMQYRVTLDGYVTATGSLSIVGGEATANVALHPADSAITGHVVDTAGAPIPGLFVTVQGADGLAGSSAATGDSGEYSVSGLAAGDYTVTVGGNGTPWSTGSQTVHTQASATGVADFVLDDRSTGSIHGVVFTTDDEPFSLAKVCVVLIDVATGATVDGGMSSDEGTYAVDDIAPGSYTLAFWDCDYSRSGYATTYLGDGYSLAHAQTVVVAAGVDTVGADVHLAEAGSISGQLSVQTAAGVVPLAAARGVVATVFQQVDGSWVPVPDYASLPGAASSGAYAIRGLHAGNYRVGFLDAHTGIRSFAPAYWNGATTLAGAATVKVDAGKATTGIDGVVHIPTPTTPAVAVATSALVPGDENLVSAPATLTPGAAATVTVGSAYIGEWVSVWAHSTPTAIGGWHQVGPDGTVSVTVPTTVAAGTHRLAVQAADGTVIGWATVKVASTAPTESPSAGNGTPAGTGSSTGTGTGTTAQSASHASHAGASHSNAPAVVPPAAVTLATIVATYGADTEALLRTYLQQTGQQTPPNLVDLIAANDGTDLDLGAFSGSISWSAADASVSVYGYSSPTFLGRAPVIGGKAQLTDLDIASLGAGTHHLLIVGEQSGDFQVAAIDVPGAPAPSATKTPAAAPPVDPAVTPVAADPFPVGWLIAGLVVLVTVAGLVVFSVARLRRW